MAGGGTAPPVVLHVNSEGAIIRLENVSTGEDIPYAIHVESDSDDASRQPEAQAKVTDLFDNPCILPSHVLAAAHHALPLVNFTNATQTSPPTGVAYVLDGTVMPCSVDDIPFRMRYASSMLMVEIESKNPEFDLSDRYFMERTGKQAIEALFCPGLGDWNDPGVSDNPDHLCELGRYSSEFITQDPFLEPYSSDYPSRWRPVMRRGADSIGIFKSDWRTVSEKYRTESNRPVHYYIVVKADLAPAVNDQIMHLLANNPENKNWSELTGAVELARAEQMSRHAAGVLARRLADEIDVRIIKDRQTHTMSNILRTAEYSACYTADREHPTGNVSGPIFLSEACSTLDVHSGIISAVGQSLSEGIMWWFGAPTRHIGGSAWRNPETASIFPTNCSSDLTRDTFMKYRRLGYDPKWGFAKLDCVCML